MTDFPMGLWALSLERSKGTPVQLALGMSQMRLEPPSELCDLTGPNIQNTESLQFCELNTIEDLTQTFLNFPQSMPNIRSLELLDDDGDDDDHDDDGWDPTIDPFGPFPNTLRSLALYDIPLYPSFLKPGTLTELSLHYYMTPPSLDAIFDCGGESLTRKCETNLRPLPKPRFPVSGCDHNPTSKPIDICPRYGDHQNGGLQDTHSKRGGSGHRVSG